MPTLFPYTTLFRSSLILPLKSLDQLTLQKRLEGIGKIKDEDVGDSSATAA